MLNGYITTGVNSIKSSFRSTFHIETRNAVLEVLFNFNKSTKMQLSKSNQPKWKLQKLNFKKLPDMVPTRNR